MKVRVLSVFVLILVLVPFLLIGGYPFAFAISIIGILGYKEILDLKKDHKEIPFTVKILGLISLIYLIVGNYGVNTLNYAINFPKILLPIILVLIPTIMYKKGKYTTHDALYLLGWIYLLGIFCNLVIIIRNLNLYLLIYLLSVTIFTDTFAYLIGSLIGKHKMAPLISPKKSWEGFFGGLIGGVVIPVIIYANLIEPFSIKLVLVTIILSLIGQLGDLFFSRVKRENGIKDFSNLLPGHGGALDRLDSLIFVVMAYVILISII